jgi:CubicO group peptidase (beta-lactamase class C family)
MTKLQSRWLLLAFWIVIGVLTAPLAGQDLPTAKPEDVGVSSTKVEELSKFMQSLVDQGKIAGGVTMMARHGKVVHLKAVGKADRDENNPMRTDAIFRIASMTKPITCVAIMKLWEQGKLRLDDPVSKYIPEFENPQVVVRVDPLETRPAKGQITIRHLLTHTAGLGYIMTDKIGPIYEQHGLDGGMQGSPLSNEQYIRKLAAMPLLFDPGERWEYSMSIDVLGQVVQVASGRTLERFIEDCICRPIGMVDTSFRVPSEKLSRLVSAYVPTAGGIRKLEEGETLKHLVYGRHTTFSSDFPYSNTNRYFSAGAGLCSTATDYMRFCQMLLNLGQLNGTRLLREETVKMTTTNQLGSLPNRFGFGLGIMDDTDDIHRQLRGSYNGGGAWSTSFRISPRGDWIVITMAQMAFDDKATLDWFAQYEKIAAEAIQD